VQSDNGPRYDIPLRQVGHYRSRPLIIRSATAESLLPVLAGRQAVRVAFVRLPAAVPAAALRRRAEGLPVELMLDRPGGDYVQLYRNAVLLEDHPVRVSMPGTADAEPAMKLAVSLGFAVQLRLAPSLPAEIAALGRMLDRYLHHGGTDQPVEPFHSLLLHHLGRDAADLWILQESDPARVIRVTEEGRETLPGRLAGAAFEPPATQFLPRFRALRARDTECAHCPHFQTCGGFFKWPDPGYECRGIKGVLAAVRLAAAELHADLTAFEHARRQNG
jgi:hypothetical protein